MIKFEDKESTDGSGYGNITKTSRYTSHLSKFFKDEPHKIENRFLKMLC